MLFGDISSLFFANDLQIGDVSWVSAMKLYLLGFPQILDVILVRRFTWTLRRLNIIICKPPACQLAVSFWSLSCRNVVTSENQLLDGAVQLSVLQEYRDTLLFS